MYKIRREMQLNASTSPLLDFVFFFLIIYKKIIKSLFIFFVSKIIKEREIMLFY